MKTSYISILLLLFISCQSKENSSLKAVFPVDSLHICNLKVPDGYPQSQTHAGIAYIKEGVCGYQYWLVTSPYPNVKSGEGDQYENPLLYFGNSSQESQPPTDFIPYKYNPIVKRPKSYNNSSSYNSDPDILYDKHSIYILNRTYQMKFPIYENCKYTYNKLAICQLRALINRDSLTGFTIPREVAISDLLLHQEYTGTPTFISPSLVFINRYYRLFYLVTNTYNDGKETKQLVMLSDNNINGEYLTKKDIFMLKGNLEPWHMSVFKYKEKLYSIVCCTTGGRKKKCSQYLAEFDSALNTFTIYQRPLIDVPSYRGSAFVREDGMFILYSSIIYKLPISNSVDGRDIVMVKMPFSELLNKIKK